MHYTILHYATMLNYNSYATIAFVLCYPMNTTTLWIQQLGEPTNLRLERLVIMLLSLWCYEEQQKNWYCSHVDTYELSLHIDVSASPCKEKQAFSLIGNPID